ncbi:MAG: O-antigen ligase family protein [Alphaproteobacteria bacterium]|nr:O-antigen ligase family protein [Alphaproteobacteria bacterium]
MTISPTPRWISLGLVLVAVLLPTVAWIAPLGVAPLGIVVSLAAVAGLAFSRQAAMLAGVPLWHVAILAAWGLIGAIWAVDPLQTVSTTVKLGLGALGGLASLSLAGRLDERTRGLVSRAMVATFVATLLILAIEYGSERGVARLLLWLKRGDDASLGGFKSPLNRGATVLALLLWPVVVLTARMYGRAAAWVLALSGIGLMLRINSNSTQISALAATMFFLAASRWPAAAFRALRYGMVGIAVALPLAVQFVPPPQVTWESWLWLPNSAHHRLTIWQFTGQRIADRPVLGWGVDAARTIPGGEEEVQVSRPPHGATDGLLEQLMPLHPHNAVLQWWMELGGIGVAMMLALLWTIVRRIEDWAPDRPTAAAWGASFVAAFSISAVSYGFWQSWWQAALWLVATLCVAASGLRRAA